MSVIFMLLIGAFDLTGVFFNIRMLLKCFKDKTKYTLLQKCRTLIICQCVCQVTILVTNAVESWKLLHDVQPTESCDMFRALSISVIFFQAFNYVILMNMNFSADHRKASVTCGVSLKLKVLAAFSLGCVGSAMIWYSCFSQEFLSQTAVERILFVVTIAFVVLLFAADSTNNIHDQLDDTAEETSIETCSLLWSVCKENKRSMLFIALLLICLVVILAGVPWSSLSLDFEQARFFQVIVYSLITRFVFGIVLPLTISDLIDESYVEQNERTILIV